MRRILHRGQPLHRPGIRKSESSDRAVRPGLPRGPLDGVEAIAAFILIRTELAVGSIASTNVLHHDCISALDRMLESGVLLERRFFAVRGAINQHGKRARVARPQNVRAQR